MTLKRSFYREVSHDNSTNLGTLSFQKYFYSQFMWRIMGFGFLRFDPFAFTIIHGIGRSTKIKTGKGPPAKTTHRTIRSSALPCFRAPDLSVMETTRLDR